MERILKYGGLVFGVFALSTSAIFVKLADAPSAVTAFYRLFFALLFLVPFVLLHKGRRAELLSLPKKTVGLSVLAGILLAIHYIMWFESLRFTSVASSTVLVTLQPLFSIGLGYYFLKERQTKTALIGCGIALVGSFVIGYGDFKMGMEAFFGDVLALLAAGVISVYFFIGQLIRKDTSATIYSGMGYAGSAVFLAVYALVQGDSFTAYSLSTWQCFVGLALVSTIMGQFILNLLLKWFSATTISTSVLGEPVGTCILAYFILQERIGLQQGIGMLIILGGLGIYFFAEQIEKRI